MLGHITLDYDFKSLVLNGNDEDIQCVINNASFYKLRIKRYISSVENEKIIFKSALTYNHFKTIIQLFMNQSEKCQWNMRISDKLTDFLNKKEANIKVKCKVGRDIKNKDERIYNEFISYKNTVDLCMVRQLREKQTWDSLYMASMEKSGNFSVPGSGKTASVLGVYAFLKKQGLINKIVMIGPKNAFGSWIDEFVNCFGENEKLVYFNIHDKKYKNKKNKISALKYDTGNTNLFLFNYEALGSFKNELLELVDDKCLLVYDEIHKVKSLQGKNAENALSISVNAKYCVAMTGTPIPNTYLDIYNFLHILYRDDYKEFFGFTPQMLKKPDISDIENINNRIYPFFCRTTKEELNVPAANQDIIYTYRVSETENKLFIILYQKFRGNKFRMLIRMLQLESSANLLLKRLDLSEFQYILDDNVVRPADIDFVDYSQEIVKLINSLEISSKMQECLSLIKRLVSDGKPVILWCIFKETMILFKQLLIDINVKIINGEVALDERNNIINDFKNKKIDVLVTNPHTLAESVSLHSVCHDAIYFEYSYNLVHLLQSKDRIHRLGLPSNQYTQYYYFMDEFDLYGEVYSLDLQIFNRLSEKENIMLNAINNNKLEAGSSSDYDLDLIFTKLFTNENLIKFGDESIHI